MAEHSNSGGTADMTVRPEQLDQIVSGRAVFFIPEDCGRAKYGAIRKMQKKYFLKDAHCAGYEHKSKAKLLRYAKEEIVSKKSQK